jgi:hypothetical protein
MGIVQVTYDYNELTDIIRLIKGLFFSDTYDEFKSLPTYSLDHCKS